MKHNKQQPHEEGAKLQLSEGMKLLLVLAAVIGFALVTASKVLLVHPTASETEQAQPNPKTTMRPITIGTTPLTVEVRQTEAEKELGLSWRSSMPENEGMVFLYQKPQKVLYWMKGMQFPLDFIWVAGDKVVEVTPEVAHPTREQPVIQTVSPQAAVDMVIEVNAGWIQNHQIKVGDAVGGEK